MLQSILFYFPVCKCQYPFFKELVLLIRLNLILSNSEIKFLILSNSINYAIIVHIIFHLFGCHVGAITTKLEYSAT